MAKSCSNCGSPLKPGVKFCTNCGAKVEEVKAPAPEQAPAVEEKPVEPPQKAQDTVKKDTSNIPAYMQPGYFKKSTSNTAESTQQKSKIKLILVAVLLIAAIIIACVLIFRGCGKGKDNSVQSTDSLREYAESLEKAGMTEAAAAVYELIAKGGGAEYIQKAHEDIPIIEASDEAEQIGDIFGGAKGGDEE